MFASERWEIAVEWQKGAHCRPAPQKIGGWSVPAGTVILVHAAKRLEVVDIGRSARCVEFQLSVLKIIRPVFTV